MTDSEALENPNDDGSLRAGLLVLIVLVLAVVLPALPERLGVAEAGHLVRLLGPDASRDATPIESAWSLVVGTMERPSRLLGVLSAALALALLFLSGGGLRRRGRIASLLFLAALPLFWTAALEIGAGGWALAAGGLWVGLLRFVGMPMPTAALLGAGLGFLLQIFGPGPANEHEPRASLARLLPETPLAELPPLVLQIAAGLILVGLLWSCGRRAAVPVLTALVVVAPALLVEFDLLDEGPLGPGLIAGLPPLALAFGWAIDGAARRPTVPILLLVVLVLLAAASPIATRLDRVHDDRARLDAVSSLMNEAGWLALLGDRGPVLRYYEMVGHRVPGRSYLIRDETEEEALVRAAIVEKPPMVVLADPPPTVVSGLLGSYHEVQIDAVPEGFVLLVYGKKN